MKLVKIFFGQEWSDGGKWIMGIIATLLTTFLIYVSSQVSSSIPPKSQGKDGKIVDKQTTPVELENQLNNAKVSDGVKEPLDQIIKLQFEGVGAAPDKIKKNILRERAATLAAEVDADRQYAKWKNGVTTSSVTIVSDFELSEDTIRQNLNASKMSGLKTVRKEYNAEEATAHVIREVAIKINR